MSKNKFTPETMRAGSDTPPGIFILEAILEAAPEDWEQTFFPNGVRDGSIEVVLTANGVQVPFATVVQGFWERASADLEAQTKKAALEMLSEAALSNIHDALREAEYKIELALAERFPSDT